MAAGEQLIPPGATIETPTGEAHEEDATPRAVLQAVLDEDVVVMADIVQAKVMASLKFTGDASERAVGKSDAGSATQTSAGICLVCCTTS